MKEERKTKIDRQIKKTKRPPEKKRNRLIVKEK